MSHYNIAFAGLGSIGKRHFTNVCNFLAKRGDTYSIDLYRSNPSVGLEDEVKQNVSNIFRFGEEVKNGRRYDMVFVTNPTSMHYETVNKFCNHTKAFFIEKPIFDNIDVDSSFLDALDDKIAYIACPLRYHAVLQYVRNTINYLSAFSARAISSSYLPDWRPGQDYRKCYSAHRSLGGGVDIDLIHEWDYLTWLFGMPTSVCSIRDKVSDLDIDSNDIAVYIGRSKHTVIEVHLDYFGREPIRILDLFLPDDTVRCDIINGQIEFMKSGRTVNVHRERNEYHMREIVHFFDIVDGKKQNDSTAKHAYDVLKLTKGII